MRQKYCDNYREVSPSLPPLPPTPTSTPIPLFIYFFIFIFLSFYVCPLSGDNPAFNTYVYNDGIKQLAEFVQRIFLARPSVTISVMLNLANASPETRWTWTTSVTTASNNSQMGFLVGVLNRAISLLPFSFCALSIIWPLAGLRARCFDLF